MIKRNTTEGKAMEQLFLSNEIRDLMCSEMLEHEEQCGQYTEMELASIEQYWWCLTNEKLLIEYQNYFGSN